MFHQNQVMETTVGGTVVSGCILQAFVVPESHLYRRDPEAFLANGKTVRRGPRRGLRLLASACSE